VITQEALDEIYAVYGYGPKAQNGIAYTVAIKKIRDGVIPEQNAIVDHDNRKEKAEPHCDGELLSECNRLVINAARDGVNYIISGDLEKARISIGGATHTLQDFYAHSNWTESRGAAVNPYMGFSEFPAGAIALPSEDTCVHPNLPIPIPTPPDWYEHNQEIVNTICRSNFLYPALTPRAN
jgi:hypothetical protein